MKHKVGEKVRIKDVESLNVVASPLGVGGAMWRFAGSEAKITGINERNGYYTLNIDDGWFCWSDEMLETIEGTGEYIIIHDGRCMRRVLLSLKEAQHFKRWVKKDKPRAKVEIYELKKVE